MPIGSYPVNQWALFLFIVFFLQVCIYSAEEIFCTFYQLLSVLNGANEEILIIAAVANQGSVGDQLAILAGQDFRFQIVHGEPRNDSRMLLVILAIESNHSAHGMENAVVGTIIR